MKKFAKKFFGIQYGCHSGNYFDRPYPHARLSYPYEIIKNKSTIIFTNADIVTVSLIITKLCGVIHLNWFLVLLPMLIHIICSATFDIIDNWIVRKIEIEREAYYKQCEKEDLKRLQSEEYYEEEI